MRAPEGPALDSRIPPGPCPRHGCRQGCCDKEAWESWERQVMENTCLGCED